MTGNISFEDYLVHAVITSPRITRCSVHETTRKGEFGWCSSRDLYRSMKEMLGGCCVCSDERGWTENPLVYCDGQGCTVAVHQGIHTKIPIPLFTPTPGGPRRDTRRQR